MTRTLISLSEEDRRWLRAESRRRRQPMAAIIRRALQQAREGGDAFEKLLQDTSGLWPHGDGLAWQRQARADWQA